MNRIDKVFYIVFFFLFLIISFFQKVLEYHIFLYFLTLILLSSYVRSTLQSTSFILVFILVYWGFLLISFDFNLILNLVWEKTWLLEYAK